MLLAGCACVILMHPGLAGAQQRDSGALVGDSLAEGDEYRGVVPGRDHRPPRARRLPSDGRRTWVTWPGFEVSAEGSRVFIQTTAPVTYRRADEPGQVVLVLENTRIHLSNNRNSLVTEHFDTPVARIYLRRERRNTVLVLEMKVAAEPTIRESTQGEYSFLFLEFPPGNYPMPAADATSRPADPQ